jgi:hypothetical protein
LTWGWISAEGPKLDDDGDDDDGIIAVYWNGIHKYTTTISHDFHKF